MLLTDLIQNCGILDLTVLRHKDDLGHDLRRLGIIICKGQEETASSLGMDGQDSDHALAFRVYHTGTHMHRVASKLAQDLCVGTEPGYIMQLEELHQFRGNRNTHLHGGVACFGIHTTHMGNTEFSAATVLFG